MKIFSFSTVLFFVCSVSGFDPTILGEGNSWLYAHKIEKGPTVPRVIFEGQSYLEIDTVYGRNDSLFVLVNAIDEDEISDSTYKYQITYSLANGVASELNFQGNRPQLLTNTLPWFMIGSEMTGNLSYVRFDGIIRLLSKWNSGPGPTNGTTINGKYLQGIGLVEYSSNTFGGLARDAEYISLLKHNNMAFDSNNVEDLGVSALYSDRQILKNRKSNWQSFNWTRNKYFINGKIKASDD